MDKEPSIIYISNNILQNKHNESLFDTNTTNKNLDKAATVTTTAITPQLVPTLFCELSMREYNRVDIKF